MGAWAPAWRKQRCKEGRDPFSAFPLRSMRGLDKGWEDTGNDTGSVIIPEALLVVTNDKNKCKGSPSRGLVNDDTSMSWKTKQLQK